MSGAGCSYALDHRDRILWVGETWDEWARASSAPHLLTSEVVGRSLWTLIGDARLRALLGILLAKVRRSHAPLRLPFRCDAPDEKRWMEIEICAGPRDTVVMRTEQIDASPREVPPSMEWRLATDADEDDRVLWICSWCNAVLSRDDRWIELEEDLALDPRRYEPTPAVAHRLCGRCERRLEAASH